MEELRRPPDRGVDDGLHRQLEQWWLLDWPSEGGGSSPSCAIDWEPYRPPARANPLRLSSWPSPSGGPGAPSEGGGLMQPIRMAAPASFS